MKLAVQTLEDMQRFYDEGPNGEVSLADRGCSCFQNAPCSRCTHPGNPHAVDAIEAWESPEDAGEFAVLFRLTSEYLRRADFKLATTTSIAAGRAEFARWVDYANREVALAWDLEENCPLFRAKYGIWRTPMFTTVEAAFLAAELDNWGRNTPLHELADMAYAPPR